MSGERVATPATIRDLTVVYGETVALSHVDLDIRPGTVTAVTGESGAGKSTLLWALAGHLPAATGSITAPRAALMPQSLGLAALLTARENVAAPLLPELPPDQAWSRADEHLDRLGLTDVATHLVDELSGGQQQRVAVARLLAGGAPLLLADEPTAALDHRNAELVMRLFAATAAADGSSVVVATHDQSVAALADVVVTLVEGRPA